MKTFADDRQVLTTLTPEHLRNHLQASGWSFTKPFLEHGELWDYQRSSGPSSAPSSPNAQILLPKSADLGDYLPRIQEALAALETVERRTQAEILLDLLPSIPNFETQGIITNLYEGAREGRITLMGIVLNKLQRIYIELPEPIYEIALQAYRGRIPVICKGSLSKHKQTFELGNLQKFNLDLEIPVFAIPAAS